ncbi:MAG TPA: SGNH/GDSL hydrolase family protein [Verrucomicrobiae bacterium]|nr:SGNH/GDSL hydrolase family protein [Verrucomicrobiae bacterium]
MRIKSLVLLGIAAISFPLSAQSPRPAAADFVRATNNDIVVEGRYIAMPDGGVHLGFPGVALYCRYSGSALTMRVKGGSDEVFFDVVVDHGKPTRLRVEQGEHDYSLLREASPAEHLIKITRRTESWQGTCEVVGFDLGPDGRLLSPPQLPARKLLFVGDSITCGAMIDYNPHDPLNGHTKHDAQWSNARLTFCKTLAHRLHAQCHLVSYGGRGMIRDWQGLDTVANAPQFYELALPDDPSALWDHNRYVPDAVVICLGGNDFNSGIPDEMVFVNAYVQFVEKVRRDAPNAWIFLLNCPMFKDKPGKMPKRAVLRAYLEEIITKLNDPHVVWAPVGYSAGNPIDHHPTAADHEAIAGRLEPVLRKALNW